MPHPDAPGRAEPATSPSTTPSSNLLANLRRELMRRLPFSQMPEAAVDRFVAACSQAYFAPDERVLGPEDGPVAQLVLVRQGSITGRRGLAELAAGEFEYQAGDLFPVSAALAGRAVTATYTANEDTFCLLLPVAVAQALAADCPPFADFLHHRVQQFLALSRRAVQAAFASQALAEQSLEARLASLPRKLPLACPRETSLAQALTQMHERRVGSVLVVNERHEPQGILTRHDILGRVTLPQRPLSTPIAEVMSAPVHALDEQATLQDAALLMSRQGVRHVPVTSAGRLVNIVSERDLFALQRLSLKQLSTQIRAASQPGQLQPLAGQIRRFAAHLLGQGVQARQLTELISHLNDVLVERLVQLVLQQHGLDGTRACWLAFGSEGRSEQTVATDQDNGLVFESDQPDADRPAWLAMARAVNEGLDACGYPLCAGNVMASNPACCLTVEEWQARFAQWMAHGAPQDLLDASIYFDLRPVAGHLPLARALRSFVLERAQALPRFLKQMADNALTRQPPLNWRGGLDTRRHAGHDVIDLKLQGTAIFVEAARLLALAQGVDALPTRERLLASGRLMGVPEVESNAWVGAFEFLQMLRLQVQVQPVAVTAGAAADAPGAAPPWPAALVGEPNLVAVDALNDIDRHMLKETMRTARRLQQRIGLDYQR